MYGVVSTRQRAWACNHGMDTDTRIFFFLSPSILWWKFSFSASWFMHHHPFTKLQPRPAFLVPFPFQFNAQPARAACIALRRYLRLWQTSSHLPSTSFSASPLSFIFLPASMSANWCAWYFFKKPWLRSWWIAAIPGSRDTLACFGVPEI